MGQVITFTGGRLDRADGRRGDEEWLAAQRLRPDARVLLLQDLKPLTAYEALAWLPLSAAPTGRSMVFLGLESGSPRFAVATAADDPPPELGEFVELRAAAGFLSFPETAVAAHARSLVDWHARHRFCAVCGAPTAMKRGGAQRQCTVDACRAEHFPRVDPVTIMLVVKGDKCLMGRQSRFPPGMFSALAGFVEQGESIEEAVRREVLEEAGVKVGDIRYVMSQPWPFPSSLMIGCLAEALTEELTPDTDEIEELRWFSRAEIAAALKGEAQDFFIPPPLAIAHHLLKAWVG